MHWIYLSQGQTRKPQKPKPKIKNLNFSNFCFGNLRFFQNVNRPNKIQKSPKCQTHQKIKSKKTKQRGGNAVYPHNQKTWTLQFCLTALGPPWAQRGLYRHIKKQKKQHNTTKQQHKNKHNKNTKQQTKTKNNKTEKNNTKQKTTKKWLMMGLHAGEGENA